MQSLRGSAGRLRRRDRELHQPRPARGHLPPVTFLTTSPTRTTRRGSSTRCSWPPSRRRRRRPHPARSSSGSSRSSGPTRIPAAQDPPTTRWPTWRRKAGLPAAGRPEDRRRQRDAAIGHRRGRRGHQLRVPARASSPSSPGTPTVYDLEQGREGRHLRQRLAGQADVSRPDAPAVARSTPTPSAPRPRPASRPPRSSRPG